MQLSLLVFYFILRGSNALPAILNNTMKRILLLLTIFLSTLTLLGAPVFAAKPDHAGGGNGNKPPKDDTSESDPLGYDISWPQCDSRKLPSDHAFGVVGVNGGLASNTNPCLSDQLVWASSASGAANQDKVQLYVNTANPGEVIEQYNVTTWPENNVDGTGFATTNPFGTCTGSVDVACSWQYGWNRAQEANTDRFVPAAAVAGVSQTASNYVWWLDVETENSWQTEGPNAQEQNVATLEGMKAYFELVGADVGLYSTAYQWSVITGNKISADSNLNALPNWRPSGSNLNNAKANCTVDPLTPGGYISLTQFVRKNLDHNYSCV